MHGTTMKNTANLFLFLVPSVRIIITTCSGLKKKNYYDITIYCKRSKENSHSIISSQINHINFFKLLYTFLYLHTSQVTGLPVPVLLLLHSIQWDLQICSSHGLRFREIKVLFRKISYDCVSRGLACHEVSSNEKMFDKVPRLEGNSNAWFQRSSTYKPLHALLYGYGDQPTSQ